MKTNTQENYLKVAKRILNRYSRLTGYNWRSNLDDFTKWFYEQSAGIKNASFRQYKAALAYYLGIVGSSDSIEAISTMHKKRKIERVQNKKTSSQKSKKLNEKDLILILNELRTLRTPYALLLSQWLFSGEITGLRPIEWHESRVVKNENGIFLICRNAKNSHNRANGEYRTINFSLLSKDELAVIEDLVQQLSGIGEGEFLNKQKNCRELMYRVTRKVLKNRTLYPTLYSTRHQFSANAKGSGLTLEEIAALMGHATNRTATEHYGRKKDSKEPVKVKPIDSEVKTIRKTYHAKRNDQQEKHLMDDIATT